MSFIIRTLGRTVVSAAAGFAIKKVMESRSRRKAPRPRLADDRRPAQKAKSQNVKRPLD